MIADEAVARAADSALAPSTLPAPLPGGVEVRILERRSPWIRIRLANGRDAWVAESALMTVAEPDSLTADRRRSNLAGVESGSLAGDMGLRASMAMPSRHPSAN